MPPRKKKEEEEKKPVLEIPEFVSEGAFSAEELERAKFEKEKEFRKQTLPSSVQLEQQEEQREQFQEVTGSEELKEELTQQSLEPPILEPESAITTAARIGLKPAEKIAGLISNITGKPILTTDELVDTPIGKAIGLTTLAVGGVVVGANAFAAYPALAAKVAATKIGAAVAGSSTAMKLLAGGFLVSLAKPSKLADLQRNDLNKLNGVLGKMSGQSSTIQSAVQNGGLSASEGIAFLNELSNSLDETESAIKQKSIYNIRFRLSDEYLETEQKIKDARINILERVGGIENLAITGRTANQAIPDNLAIDLMELEE